MGEGVGVASCAGAEELNPARTSNATANPDFVILSESC